MLHFLGDFDFFHLFTIARAYLFYQVNYYQKSTIIKIFHQVKYYQKLTNYNYMIEGNKDFNLKSVYNDPLRDHFVYWRNVAFGKYKTLKRITKII